MTRDTAQDGAQDTEQDLPQGGAAPLPTLGERLDAQGRGLAARLLTPLPWAGPLRVFVDHAAGLVVCAGRFERVESAPDRPVPLVAERSANRSRPAASGLPGAAGREAAVPPAGPDAGLTPGRSPAPPPRPPSAAPDGPRGDVLPAATRARLRGAVGPAADALRVHQDEPADALARARRADAVTVGRDVYFRRGRLRPQEERGFGLLVHEATHVLALMRPGAAWHRATGAGARAEEAEALAAERAAAPGAFPQTGSPLPGPSARSGAVPARPPGSAAVAPAAAPAVAPAPAPPSASAAARAMAAPADREAAGAAPAPPPVDVQALRRELIDDVMRRLRDESERGG
ncbi:DUF4157 domain-containing protein [Streptomyces goshikiensis]|uniref:eCIS core domain-containing protein n=1 Tax=Streptomyces goshikiensis TaxID=1942 RepID=UPI0038653556|nr:DUF4157 domain-containing protein [Streptomyces goshikiensis]